MIIIIDNIYTGLLGQDKYPVIIQGPVERKMLKIYMNITRWLNCFNNCSIKIYYKSIIFV